MNVAAAALQPMKITRNPAEDPQIGDIATAGQVTRRVLEVERGKLFVQTLRTRYWMNLQTWREWCRKSTPEFQVEHFRNKMY